MVGVLHGGAWSAVGRHAHAENDFLQLGFPHLHLDRCGQRIAVGVYKNSGRIKVTAGGEPLLGFQQLILVVHRARIQAGQPWYQHRVVALHAADLHSAQPVQRT